jgi:hypothetical protein
MTTPEPSGVYYDPDETGDDHIIAVDYVILDAPETPTLTDAQHIQHCSEDNHNNQQSLAIPSDYNPGDGLIPTDEPISSSLYVSMESQPLPPPPDVDTGHLSGIHNMRIEVPYDDNLGISHHFHLLEPEKYKTLGVEEETVQCPWNQEECSVIFVFLFRLFVCSLPYVFTCGYILGCIMLSSFPQHHLILSSSFIVFVSIFSVSHRKLST